MMSRSTWGAPGDWHGRQLRHRIFFALGAAIVLSVGVAGFIAHATAGGEAQWRSFEAFASDRFRSVWDDATRRDDLARSIEHHFRVQLVLRDRSGQIVYGEAGKCPHARHRLEVVDGNRALGHVEACILPRGWPRSLIVGLGSVVLVLWAMSGLIARKLVRPLDGLVRVVRDIGDGHLDARIRLCGHRHRGEVGEVAKAVNLMAEKIERQIVGQRELLAAVSHEIRSPLARLRMLVELQREAEGDSSRLESMDLELAEMDGLVGQLLAQSRLEFQTLDRRSLLAIDVARTALERATLPTALLIDDASNTRVSVDVSLFGRALLNLLDNAQRHGQGLRAFVVRCVQDQVQFEIRDQGVGFDEAILRRGFEPFVGNVQGGGLGLGLSLVDRILRAHGGTVTLSNAMGGGGIATVELPRAGAS
jgi:two-component system, OmpR family, sensor kinase